MKNLTFALASTSLMILTAAGCGSSDNDSPTSERSSVSRPDDSPATETSFKDGVLTTPDLRIEITKTKIIPFGDPGNEYNQKESPVFAVYWKITNVSGESVTPVLAVAGRFNAYQDNDPNTLNELEVGSLPDARFGETQTEEIKKGGTVAYATAFELDDLTTPVDLVALEGFDDELGRITYDIK